MASQLVEDRRKKERPLLGVGQGTEPLGMLRLIVESIGRPVNLSLLPPARKA